MYTFGFVHESILIFLNALYTCLLQCSPKGYEYNLLLNEESTYQLWRLSLCPRVSECHKDAFVYCKNAQSGHLPYQRLARV